MARDLVLDSLKRGIIAWLGVVDYLTGSNHWLDFPDQTGLIVTASCDILARL